MNDYRNDSRRSAGGQHNIESDGSGDDPPGSDTELDPEAAAEELSSYLAEIYEAVSQRHPVEVVLATASVVGRGPEQCQTGQIERELHPELRREVALTRIRTMEGYYRCERVAPRSPHWEFETGRVPVRAAELCEQLGIDFDEAADALFGAEGPPEGAPFGSDTIYEPAVVDELLKRVDGGDAAEQTSERASKNDGSTRQDETEQDETERCGQQRRDDNRGDSPGGEEDRSEVEVALDEAFAKLFRVYDTPPHDISKRAYLEICLAVAEKLGGGGQGTISARALYRDLSRHAQSEIDPSRGGVGITNIGDACSTLHIEEREHKPTLYSVGELTADAHAALKHFENRNISRIAKAVDQQEQADESELIENLFYGDSESRSLDREPPPTGTADREGEQAGEGRRGRDRAGTSAGSAPNGREANPAYTDPHAGGGSERSIRPRHEPNRKRWETRGTREQRRFLDERVRMPAERLLFLHLLAHARKGTYGAGEDEHMEWITVPAEKMEKEMGAPYHSTKEVWKGSELIEPYRDGHCVPPTSDSKGKARQFRIDRDALKVFTSLGKESKRYYLHTEEPQRTSPPSPMTTDLSTDSNNEYPPLIDGALRVLSATPQPVRVDEIKRAVESLADKDGKTPAAQKANLQLALETIERQTTHVENGIAYLQNAYTPIFGGRILFKNGGPQGMLGAVKARAFDIEGLFNYDIKSCHTTGLKEVADKLAAVGIEIDVSPWENYAGKYKVARRTELPATLVKITEHAIKYGAYLPASIAQTYNVFAGTSIDPEKDLKLVKAAKKYVEEPDEALGKLHDVFAGMRRVVKKISKALLNEYWEEHRGPCGPGGYCMKNACGVTFRPSEWSEGHERETKVMAWMLQGLEAAFVHSITLLSAVRIDFRVVANEHDGLIVMGEIPLGDDSEVSAVISYARQMSGFHRAQLVKKPHANEDEIAEIYSGADEQPEDEDAFDRADRYYAERDVPQLTAEEYEEMHYGRAPKPSPSAKQEPEEPRPGPARRRRRTDEDDEKSDAYKKGMEEYQSRRRPRRERGLPTGDRTG